MKVLKFQFSNKPIPKRTSMILTFHVPPEARGQRLCDIDSPEVSEKYISSFPIWLIIGLIPLYQDLSFFIFSDFFLDYTV